MIRQAFGNSVSLESVSFLNLSYLSIRAKTQKSEKESSFPGVVFKISVGCLKICWFVNGFSFLGCCVHFHELSYQQFLDAGVFFHLLFVGFSRFPCPFAYKLFHRECFYVTGISNPSFYDPCFGERSLMDGHL